MENERGVGIILKWVLQEWGGGGGLGLLGPKIGTTDGLFCTSYCIVGTTKYRELLEPLGQGLGLKWDWVQSRLGRGFDFCWGNWNFSLT
jgi:hypothetical protein